MKKAVNLLFVFTLISLIIGYVFGEDSLGGAKHDYNFHEKFIKLFAEDFYNTIRLYGSEDFSARNSPIFYIILSFLFKFGLPLKIVKYINFFLVILLFHSFYICLKEKYPKINYLTLILFFSAILLSPTIRSLLIWPYPFVWALILFLYSVYYYLKFNFSKVRKDKFKFAIKNIFFVASASYLTPNFAIFTLYFFFYYYKYFGISKNILTIIATNLFLAVPAAIYYYLTDFYILNNNYPFPNLNLNFSNKIIIISTLILFYFLPFIKIKDLYKNLISFKLNKNIFYLSIFVIINLVFFNFIKNAGGGIFFHASNLIFNNSIIVFFAFTVFVLMMRILGYINVNNLILFVILLVFNIQYTIYHKYFDPLLLFIFLFLFKFGNKKKKIDITTISTKNFILYLCFLMISLVKSSINY